MFADSVVCKLFEGGRRKSTFVANALHAGIFLRMELLDVTSALTRELELLLASKASEPSFHVLHHNVNSQITLITAHVAASITSCR